MLDVVALADLVLIAANVVYGTSYLASRIALDGVPPVTLALVRLMLATCVLGVPALLWGERLGLPRRDAWRVFWMGVLGFAVAYTLAHWGLSTSSVTNAALLVIVEPVSLIVLAPLALGERLTRAEAMGAVTALLGTLLVVTNGIPGVSERLFPAWRGDVLLILSGLAYAAYSLIGRDVLARHRPMPVTLVSILWGMAGITPLAAAEMAAGQTIRVTAATALAMLYVGVVVTGLGYLVWNWGLRRVRAARAGVFLTVQPVVGALSGVLFRGEQASVFTVIGGALIVAGLVLTVARGRGTGGARTS
jgi:drug/metabolite transporter (DMT)-like permease